VGLNLRSDHEAGHDETGYTASDDAAARSAIEAGGARVSRSSAASEGAQGQLDAHGRPVTAQAPKERLEIPAFLRKHG